MGSSAQFRLRIYHADTVAIGPGKVALLEAIERTGSISAAGRSLGMSYRRAWVLVDELNRTLREPAVTTAKGGAQGGGSTLTAQGQAIVRHYRAIEQIAERQTTKEMAALRRLLAP